MRQWKITYVLCNSELEPFSGQLEVTVDILSEWVKEMNARRDFYYRILSTEEINK